MPRHGRPWCDHCKRPGHTKESCWKIHGRPVDWKPLGHTASSSQFSPDQMNILHSIINRAQIQGSQMSSTGAVVQQGNLSTTSSSWIVDSGASDHMTGNRFLFTNLAPCTHEIFVSIADGSRSHWA